MQREGRLTSHHDESGQRQTEWATQRPRGYLIFMLRQTVWSTDKIVLAACWLFPKLVCDALRVVICLYLA